MCGIAGFFGLDVTEQHSSELMQAMAATIARRGPDGQGFWRDTVSGVCLVHTRLAIQDPSEAGSQPMHSPSGEWVVVFNGELYNFLEVRARLENDGCKFLGHSDTEVLVNCLDLYGFRDSLELFDGMFAVAAYNKKTRSLFLARDRLGEKPLYFGVVGKRFVFSSTLAAFSVGISGRLPIDQQAFAQFMKYKYIPAPRSIYQGVHKLKPAHMVCVQVGLLDPAVDFEQQAFWKLDPAEAGVASVSADSLLDDLDGVLCRVVDQQLISDRPLGCFLSGGIDSSLVAALMQERASGPIKTFTIGFEQAEYNEASYARAIANHLGTDHTEFMLDPSDALSLVPDIATAYDEPFADSSQLPTMVVSRMARQDVVVSLSGDGGDESFAGYTRYFQCVRDWQRLMARPAIARKLIAWLSKAVATGVPEALITRVLQAVVPAFRSRRFRSVAMRWNQDATTTNLLDHYHHYLSDSRFENLSQQPPEPLFESNQRMSNLSSLRQLMAIDLMHYLPDDVLTKVDRATMHFSLESRAPLLDRRVVEFAWQFPDELLMADGRGKYPLRQLLSRRVPENLTDREKQGFALPIRDWLRTELRGWAEALLRPERLSKDDLFDVNLVRKRWQQLIEGEYDNSSLIWSVLMFESWRESVS